MLEVKLADRRGAYWDPYTKTHLTISDRRRKFSDKEIANMDMSNIVAAIKTSALIVTEGTLPELEDEQDDEKSEVQEDALDNEDSEDEEEVVKEDEDEADEQEDENEEEEEVGFTEEDLEEFNVTELKDICRDEDISGYSSLNKSELIDLILEEL